MDNARFKRLVDELRALPRETEWVEFKQGHAAPEEIGERISALANGACLKNKHNGYLVFGIRDEDHEAIGTTFTMSVAKKGNEELEHWLLQRLDPRLPLTVHEDHYNGQHVVIVKIPAARERPVRFTNIAYIRIGSITRSLRDFPEIERQLWLKADRNSFEAGVCKDGLTPEEVVQFLDCQKYFDLLGMPFPSTRDVILERLIAEKFVGKEVSGYSITNLGAILIAKDLRLFDLLGRKAVRVIVYEGNSRVRTLKDQPEHAGYAVSFERLIESVSDKLPSNEEIQKALRKNVSVYPPLAIRELVANALIHQDFNEHGTGPMVEIFTDRIEITNPGLPVITPERFIDEYQSRNEALAAFLRRSGVCEEKGSGIDKVIFQVEVFQLPAPDFLVGEKHTKVALFGFKKFQDMDREDRVRACYQHCCLKYVSNQKMGNETLRDRFKIEAKNSAVVSRIIGDTLKRKLIKYEDAENVSRKYAKYVPFWA